MRGDVKAVFIVCCMILGFLFTKEVVDNRQSTHSIHADSLTARVDSLILVSLDQCIQLVRARHLDPHDYCALKLVVPEDSEHE